MNKQQTLIAIVVLVIIGGFVWFSAGKRASAPASDEPIKIGVIIPLSGPMSFVGDEVRRGVELAQQDYPNSGVEVVFEDDQLPNNTASLNALNKLLSVDQVDVVFNSVVNTIKTLAPTLNEKHTPGIVLWDNSRAISTLGDYVFGMGFSTELAGERMAEFSYQKLSVKHIAVITAQDEWSELISKAFIEKFKALGGIIDLQEKIKLTDGDVRSVILKIKQKNSQAIYFPIALQSLSGVVKQAHELGYRGQLLSADAFTKPDIDSLKGLADGVYVTNIDLNDPAFIAKYKQKYGEVDPMNVAFSAMGYDAVKLIVELSNQMQQKHILVTAKSIKDNLVGFHLEGFTGATTFSPDHTTDKRESIFVIKNGNFTLVEK